MLKLDKISPHTHLFILSGGLLDVDYVWQICLKIAQAINKYFSIKNIDSYLNLIPPKNLTLLKKAQEIGFKYICYNLEVFGKNNFKIVCPGKDMVYGYKEFLKVFEYSVSLFGRGKVRCNFVLGAQPVNQLLAGVKILAEKGIVADYTEVISKP